MAAEVNFMQRGEPAQFKSAVGSHKKRGLRLVMLLCHFEKRLVRQPLFQRTYRCRVAAKGFVAEGIHQIKINFPHCLFLFCYQF